MRALICRATNGLVIASAMVVLSTPALAFASAQPRGALPSDIEGRAWRISRSSEDRSQSWPLRRPGRQPNPYLRFADGVLEGSPGCGQFAGKYQKTGDLLSISANWRDSEQAACDDKTKHDVKEILEALERSGRFTSCRSIGTMTLYSSTIEKDERCLCCRRCGWVLTSPNSPTHSGTS